MKTELVCWGFSLFFLLSCNYAVPLCEPDEDSDGEPNHTFSFLSFCLSKFA